jgi:hypothetical protein
MPADKRSANTVRLPPSVYRPQFEYQIQSPTKIYPRKNMQLATPTLAHNRWGNSVFGHTGRIDDTNSRRKLLQS